MYDASKLDYDKNVEATRAAREWAHANGLYLEAELGEVGGKDGAHAPGVRTDPGEAAEFVAATGVDALAVAVGSSHAMTDRVGRARPRAHRRAWPARSRCRSCCTARPACPTTSSAPAVRAGMVKINIGTILNVEYTAAVREALAGRRSAGRPAQVPAARPDAHRRHRGAPARRAEPADPAPPSRTEGSHLMTAAQPMRRIVADLDRVTVARVERPEPEPANALVRVSVTALRLRPRRERPRTRSSRRPYHPGTRWSEWSKPSAPRSPTSLPGNGSPRRWSSPCPPPCTRSAWRATSRARPSRSWERAPSGCSSSPSCARTAPAGPWSPTCGWTTRRPPSPTRASGEHVKILITGG